MTENPIFIIGTERSGSNLLRVILNAHSRVTAPHPPHVVRYFAPFERSYGALTQDQNFRRLADDILWLLRCHIHPWEIAIDPHALLEMAPARSSFGIVAALYEQHRVATGKARWCCKSTFMVDHCRTILQHFPKAQIIFLVRDPRDVAASSRRSIFSTYEPYFTAQLWRRQQLTGLSLLDELPPATIHLLRYEDRPSAGTVAASGAGFRHKVRQLLVIASASRGGSGLFAELLRGSSSFLHLRGELNPLLVLNGHSFSSEQHGFGRACRERAGRSR